MSRLKSTFDKLRADGRKGLIVYLCAGDPDLAASLALVPKLVDAGADIIELGLPFSDPLADGPVIQAAAHRALSKGVNTPQILDGVKALRTRGFAAPLVLMGSFNPVLAMGTARFLERARSAGVDGLIISDLPLDEAGDFSQAAQQHGIDVILLAAPTTSKERLVALGKATRGFLYFVSVKGVTGQRTELPSDLPARLDAVREASPVPVAVGFGISTPDQARALAAHADAVVVGSALVQAIHESNGENAKPVDLVRALASAVHSIR